MEGIMRRQAEVRAERTPGRDPQDRTDHQRGKEQNRPERWEDAQRTPPLILQDIRRHTTLRDEIAADCKEAADGKTPQGSLPVGLS